MKLADQVAALEADNEQLKGEIERLRAQAHRQEGAIREGRAERQDLLNKLEKVTSENAYLTQHFHTIHGSAEHIAREKQEIAALYHPPAAATAQKKPSLMERLYQTREKPHADTPVDNDRSNNGSMPALANNAG